MDYADVVVAEYLCQFFGRKMCTASWHKIAVTVLPKEKR
jgi:hypothetical protein